MVAKKFGQTSKILRTLWPWLQDCMEDLLLFLIYVKVMTYVRRFLVICIVYCLFVLYNHFSCSHFQKKAFFLISDISTVWFMICKVERILSFWNTYWLPHGVTCYTTNIFQVYHTLQFFNSFHKLSVKWNKNKIWETRKNVYHIACGCPGPEYL